MFFNSALTLSHTSHNPFAALKKTLHDSSASLESISKSLLAAAVITGIAAAAYSGIFEVISPESSMLNSLPGMEELHRFIKSGIPSNF